MKKIIFLLVFLTVSCGLPSSEELEDLNLPLGLRLHSIVCSNNVPIGVKIQFYGYNNESFFSGYNIYILSYATDPQLNIETQVRSHIVRNADGEASINTNIEQLYIIKNTFGNFPTIPLSYLDTYYPNYHYKPTEITFTFDKLPNNNPLVIGTRYSIGLTAISLSNKIETLPSNVITFDYQCQ